MHRARYDDKRKNLPDAVKGKTYLSDLPVLWAGAIPYSDDGHRVVQAFEDDLRLYDHKPGCRAPYRHPSMPLPAAEHPAPGLGQPIRQARLPPPARQGAVGRSSVPAQVVEEVLDDVELPGAGRLVVDVFADGEVEYSEAEG